MAKLIAVGILVLLSVATGVTKLIQLPAEMELFGGAGFSVAAILIFGAIQVAGGLAVAYPPTRALGAWVMAVTFVIASGVVFLAGMIPFGVVSLLFIALAVFVARSAATA